MNTASILIKTDPQVKASAQKTAASMGLSLSSVINRYLKHFISTKAITFHADEEKPSKFLINSIRRAEEQLKKGETSPVFDNAKDAISWLHKQSE